MKKRTVKAVGAQGDILITRTADPIPKRATECARKGGSLIVAHSETGHHHVIDRPSVRMYQDPDHELKAWLEVHGEEGLPNLADLVHKRDFDTHGTLSLPVGRYRVHYQRESTPWGDRRVMD